MKLIVAGLLAATLCVGLTGCIPFRCGGENMMICG